MMKKSAGRRSRLPRAGGAPGAFSASYTVEASCVMAVVLTALALLIGRAYDLCALETEVFRLHHRVELARGQETENRFEFASVWAEGYSQRKTREAEGAVSGKKWKKEIAAGVHKPERLMRMLSIFQNGGGGESENGDVGEAGSQLP